MDELSNIVICPDCSGDGKETCHNPDHGFISALSFHEVGRLGCPCCGHNEKHKVPKGGQCDTCNGEKQVTEKVAREFCTSCDYDYEVVMDSLK